MKKELRNMLSPSECRKKLVLEAFPRRTLSFYRYVRIADPQAMRDLLFLEWSALGVLGRIYVSQEGINAQLNVPESNLQYFIQNLDSRTEFKNMPMKYGVEEGESFIKLTIKVKNFIVADGLPAGSYDISDVGTHLTPDEFDRALEEKDTLVVDVRNHYESRIGHFEKAFCPDVDTFREALPAVKEYLKGKEDKKVLLYCTGGIRCEKASAYLKANGFKNVHQLYGGIINYAHETRNRGVAPHFLGKNFVFDERIGERITPDVLSKCDQCGKSCDDYTNCKNAICNLLFIQCADCRERMSNCCTDECRYVASLPQEKQRSLRKGQPSHTYDRFLSRQRPSCTLFQ